MRIRGWDGADSLTGPDDLRWFNTIISGVTPSEDFADVFAYALRHWQPVDFRGWRTSHGIPTEAQISTLRTEDLLP